MNALLLAGLLLLPAPQDLESLRAEGPPALERLLARFDATPEGPERDGLERLIDAVAAQRHATASRLYWYTDLDRAVAAARRERRPILSLRLLGRLDEDLACANSRLFRIVLYADPEVSRLLRERFVLHWSTERPVPRVTIDFGDGRRIETTLAGNSAHVVLDSDGRPLDVLPGLYSAVAFRRELEAVLPLAEASPGLGDTERLARVRAHHLARLAAAADLWSREDPGQLVLLDSKPGIVEAELLAITKSFAETPALLGTGLGGAAAPTWARPRLSSVLTVRRLEEARLAEPCRALVRRLAPSDWAADPSPARGEALERTIANLEALVAADTEQDETELRSPVHGWFASATALPELDALLDRLYREVFRTPREDPWLGLASPGVFSGLPGDGIVE